jgi:uncharacterized protein (DUF433 family)
MLRSRAAWAGKDDVMVSAFTPELVQRIAGVTSAQLRYWERLGIVRPTVANYEEPGYPRLYSFRDLIALKVAAEMRRRQRRPSEIKRLMERLEELGYESPFLTLRFVGDRDDSGAGDPDEGGDAVYWFEPGSDDPLSTRELDQRADTYDLTMKDLRTGLEETIADLSRRRVGEIESVRSVQGSQPVVAGTRIPAAKIARLREGGWSVSKILDAFPRLEPEDVEAATAYQEARRASA